MGLGRDGWDKVGGAGGILYNDSLVIWSSSLLEFVVCTSPFIPACFLRRSGEGGQSGHLAGVIQS